MTLSVSKIHQEDSDIENPDDIIPCSSNDDFLFEELQCAEEMNGLIKESFIEKSKYLLTNH